MDQQKTKSKSKSLWMYIAASFAAITVFGLGYAVGNDTIQLNNSDTVASSVASNSDNDNDDDLSTSGLQELYDRLRQNYDGEISDEDLLDGLKKGVVAAVGDSFTEYLNEEATEQFNSDLDGEFEGIGAELAQEDGFVTIVAPIKGTPADRAGIQPGDIIVEIDGASATELTVFEAVTLIRGEKGTEVVLTVIREGDQVVVPIVRDTIDIPSVEYRIEDSIGVIEISRFGTDTTDLVRDAAKEFNDQSITKVILDMRGNPGGLLNEAVGVSSVWLEEGQTVLEEKSDGVVVESFAASGDPLLNGVQTIVLINEGSASASEIVAGALKDNGAATLLGQTSFGKGSVQQLINLRGGGSLKVTVARWFTPAGKNIDQEGIVPDTEIELTADDRENDRDPQFDAAKSQLQ